MNTFVSTLAGALIAGSITVGAPAARPAAAVDPPRAILVAGSAQVFAGDRPVVDRLEAAGLTVEVVPDEHVGARDFSGVALVALSTSVQPSIVGSQLNGVTAPILTWEGYSHRRLGLGRPNGETRRPSRTIEIVDSNHPLAAGATGEVRVVGSPQRMSFARPGPGAEVVARMPGRDDQAVIFTYPAGATLADGSTAPGCRTALFFNWRGASDLTGAAIPLIDAAIDHSVACAGVDPNPDPGPTPGPGPGPGPTPNQRPTADANGPYDVDEGADIGLDASGSSDPDGSIVDETWTPGGDGSPSQPWTIAGAQLNAVDDAQFTVTLTVTDDDGATDTDTARVTIRNVAPDVDAGPDRTLDLDGGDSVQASLPATLFTDPGTLDTHDVSVDWGDGTVDARTSHAYTDVGEYTVTVTVTDDDGGTGSDTTTISVIDGPCVDSTAICIPDGLASVYAVNTGDPGACRFDWVIDWGDGTVEDFGDVQNGQGFEHQFTDFGVYDVTIDITAIAARDGATCTANDGTLRFEYPDTEL